MPPETAGRLVGRDSVVAHLDGFLDAAAGGAGSLVVLTGEPGIGKTALAQECVHRATGQTPAEEFDLAERRTRSFHETVCSGVVVIEQEVRFPHDGEDRMFREVHLLHLDGGRISWHTVYCTGIWTAEEIDRQAREAPMVKT